MKDGVPTSRIKMSIHRSVLGLITQYQEPTDDETVKAIGSVC
jgi:hypothetical protein